MVYDPVSKKILLFGGDHLDELTADTWLYDPASRTWQERRPAVGPTPRFGHALVFLPKNQKVLLIGGAGYTSSTDYQAMLYRRLPLELWTYDVSANTWGLVPRDDKDFPSLSPVRETAAAVGADDTLLVVATRQGSMLPPVTWRCQLESVTPSAELTEQFGVKPGTVSRRSGPYDPEWYERGVPAVDPSATAAVLEKLAVNRWTPLECPKWPTNRMGGGWSTVALDPDRGQLLHLGGGHSSYFGNDTAHYDIATGRWSIAGRPQFALNYNYDLSGPGPWAFNNAPWGNHNYRAYTYDATCGRLVALRGPNYTLFYDPVTRGWPTGEHVTAPWPVSKYTSVLCPTPAGTVAWVQNPGPGSMGLFRLEKGREWKALAVKGDPLPATETDGSTLTYDSRRDQLLFTTSTTKEPAGQVWTYDFKTAVVSKRDPAGKTGITGKRFAREAVYLPRQDWLLMGYRQSGAVPIYDVAGNRWLSANIPGSEFMNKAETGASVDLGLAYDASRDVVWGVMCQLRPGAIQALRVDATSLATAPMGPTAP